MSDVEDVEKKRLRAIENNLKWPEKGFVECTDSDAPVSGET